MSEIEQSQTETEVSDEFAFNVMSIKKFWIIYILTFGLYRLGFYYINWTKQQSYGTKRISPFWRTFFDIFFLFALNKRIKEQSNVQEIQKWSYNLVSALYIILYIVSNIIDAGFQSSEASNILYIIDFAFFILQGMFFAYIQNKINISSGDIKGASNSKITKTNIKWILFVWALFVAFVVLITLGGS